MTQPAFLRGPAARRQQGLTLVELLVGMALGLVIVLALLTLMINVNRNNAELARTNSVIENGRFAQQLLESDLVHAGFWGGYVPTFDDLSAKGPFVNAGGAQNYKMVPFPTGLPDPCKDVATWTVPDKEQLIAIPVQVYPVPASGVAPVCGGVVTNAQPNSDILVVRHAAPCIASAGATETECKDTAGNMFFQPSRCADDATMWALSATAADLQLRKGYRGAKDGQCDVAGTAPKYRFLSTIYWVRNYFVTVGDGIPTLVRTRFQLMDPGGGAVLAHQGTETLVDGIQMMRVQLGLDNVGKSTGGGAAGKSLVAADFQSAIDWASTTSYYTPKNRGDGNADAYITCTDAGSPCSDVANGAPFNLANTVAVRIHLLARASSTTPGYRDEKSYTVGGTTVAATNDSFKRHVYSQTIRLNNISMRREVPPP